MKTVLGICTMEVPYGVSLMNAINSKETCPYIAQVFSDGGHLLESVREKKLQILLISPEFFVDELREYLPDGIFVLEDGRNEVMGIPELPYIYQYQSVDKILRIIMARHELSERNTLKEQGQTTLVGIYSPVHRIGKTTFALSVARELSADYKTLFISLEEFSGFSILMDEEYETDLTEVIYSAYQEGKLLEATLPMFVRRMQKLDYIPPVRVPVQITGTFTETGGGWKGDWMDFVSKIRNTGLYDVIVIDMGDSIRGILELLVGCDRLYVPVTGDKAAESKLKQFEEMLEELGYSEVLERARIVKLPEPDLKSGGALYVGEFMWGPMDPMARHLLDEDLYGITGRDI